MSRNHFEQRRLLQLIDVTVIVLCAVIMYRVRNSFWMPSGDYQLLLLVIVVITINIFVWWDVYRTQSGRWLYRSLTNLTAAWFTVALCVSMITFFTKSGENYSRLWVLMTFASSYAAMVVCRVLFWSYLQSQNRRDENLWDVVIVGAGELGQRACDAILEERWAGLRAVAVFDDDNSIHGTAYRGIPIRGGINDAIAYIEDRRAADDKAAVKEVWIALPLGASDKIEQLQLSLQNTATNAYLVPDLFGIKLSQYSLIESAGMVMINLSASPMTVGFEKLKRAEDIIISSLVSIVLSPLLLLVALAIKLESKGPVFFKQRRYGLDGKEILVWKFRSMNVIEDGHSIPQAKRDDPRVTRVGAFIRKYSIDELPQLINVLNGSMSLVGPRPHAVAHNEYYRDRVHGYMARHKIRPGITGWAQVNGCRGETKALENMQRRLRYDLEYIQNWSIALDVRILFKTFRTVFRDENAY